MNEESKWATMHNVKLDDWICVHYNKKMKSYMKLSECLRKRCPHIRHKKTIKRFKKEYEKIY